jgi:CheY-like chemotaxis protein
MVTTTRGQIGQTSLSGYRILVIEDEYFLAEDICTMLKELGADILGPVGDVGDAIGIVNSGQIIDGAVVDINLRNESIYPVAERLVARSIPFVFTSGYDKSAIQPRFKDIELFEKPINAPAMAQSLGRLIDGAGRDLSR